MMGETSSQSVFLVQHVHALPDGGEDVKIIGVYSSPESAHAAVERSRQREGFRDAPDGFSVDEYTVDRDEWVDGYATVD